MHNICMYHSLFYKGEKLFLGKFHLLIPTVRLSSDVRIHNYIRLEVALFKFLKIFDGKSPTENV